MCFHIILFNCRQSYRNQLACEIKLIENGAKWVKWVVLVGILHRRIHNILLQLNPIGDASFHPETLMLLLRCFCWWNFNFLFVFVSVCETLYRFLLSLFQCYNEREYIFISIQQGTSKIFSIGVRHEIHQWQ